MTTNLHEMFGLPDKKVDYKARLRAATEHMRSEVKDLFRELGLQEDDPCQRRLMDACNAWVQTATEMADAHTDHVERRVAQLSHRAVIKMRREVAMTETDTHRVFATAARVADACGCSDRRYGRICGRPILLCGYGSIGGPIFLDSTTKL